MSLDSHEPKPGKRYCECPIPEHEWLLAFGADCAQCARCLRKILVP